MKVRKITLQDAGCVSAWIDTNEYGHDLLGIVCQQFIDPGEFCHCRWTSVRTMRIAEEEEDELTAQLREMKRFVVLICQREVVGRIVQRASWFNGNRNRLAEAVGKL